MMLPDRFWAKVEITPTCWLWTGATLRDGYGQIKWDGKIVRVHRLSYATLHGWPVGPLDHLCRVRNCVNPTHLEQVDNRTNVLRGEGFIAQQARQAVCKRGHALIGANLYRAPDGSRECRTCRRYLRLRSDPGRRR